MISKGVQTNNIYSNSTRDYIRELERNASKQYHRDLVLTQRDQLRRALGIIQLGASIVPYTETLSCNIEHFKEFIKSKMTQDMNFDNIDLYYIKPISKFDLEDCYDSCDCEHYTNYQPLLKGTDVNETNWIEEDEIFWRENIRGNDSYREIYLAKSNK